MTTSKINGLVIRATFGLVVLKIGVIDGARTRDISDHNRVLYQLSYDHHGWLIVRHGVGAPKSRRE